MAGSTPPNADLIAFYGTLREDFPVREELGVADRLKWLGPCRLHGQIHDLGFYPVLTRDAGVVIGDLYRVPDNAVFEILDPYEGYWPEDPEGSMFHRVTVDLLEPEVRAWVYVYNRTPPPGLVVAGGDWSRHWAAKGAGPEG